jgi:hypothetical protein
MGARRMSEIISSSSFISDISWEYDSKLEFGYERRMDYQPTMHKVYMPSRDDYELSIATIDNAIDYGAKIIVYDNWIKPTISGKSYAEGKGVKIYSFGQFIKKIERGEPI